MSWPVHDIGGISVIENRDLPEDMAYWVRKHRGRVVVVGSVSAFRYKVFRAQLRLDLRADLERQLDAFAKRVGVDRSTVSE